MYFAEPLLSWALRIVLVERPSKSLQVGHLKQGLPLYVWLAHSLCVEEVVLHCSRCGDECILPVGSLVKLLI